MKSLRYILLLIFLGFFAKPTECTAFDLKVSDGFSQSKSTLKKGGDVTRISSSRVARQKRPKKPKGIKVIVPDVSTLVFKKFFRYSDLTVPEVTGNYTLLLYYSHSERGPPFFA